MSEFSKETQAKASTDVNAQVLMELIVKLVQELRPHAAAPSLSLDNAFERDLGIDSLGRVELLERIERRFGHRLPEHVIISAETPRDLLRWLQQSDAGAVSSLANDRVQAAPAPQALDAEVAIPTHARTLLEVLEWHAQHQPQRRHITLYGDDERLEYITYGELYTSAMAIAAALRQRDLMSNWHSRQCSGHHDDHHARSADPSAPAATQSTDAAPGGYGPRTPRGGI
jgi:acyl carrier protein